MKFLLTLFFMLICSQAQAATTWYLCTTATNWNAANSWTSISADIVGCTASTGNPVAGDTAIMNATAGSITLTISAAAAAATLDMTGFTGTLAFGTQTATITGLCTLNSAMTSTSGTLSCAGGVTLLSTVTGSFPTLTIAGTGTLTSGGFTWPGKMTFSTATTDTLSGNWITTGLTTISAAAIISKTTSDTYTGNGGLTMSAVGGSGTAKIILGGGTWSGNSALNNSLDLAGTITVSGSVAYASTNTPTLTWVSGTITTTSSTLTFTNSLTINTPPANMHWNNITHASGTPTVTLGADLQADGTFSWSSNSNLTFSGAHNLTVATFQNSNIVSSIFTFPASQTMTVNTSMFLNGMKSSEPTIKSGTPSTAFNLTYTGTPANQIVSQMIFTDVNASTSNMAIYNYGGGTLTRTTNIINSSPLFYGGPAIM